MQTRFVAQAIVCALSVAVAQAQTFSETVIRSFQNFPYGANPYGTLIRDAQGNLYGTTYQGGTGGLGAEFRLDSSGRYTVLHSFKGDADGANPYAPVIVGPDGGLYGTTYGGGAANAGIVYKLDASGNQTVLYSFTGGADGGYPYAGVIIDASGNIYGTTSAGGNRKSCYPHGCGVVYKIDPSGHESVLYTFTGGADGAAPRAGVIADPAGNLYGTTEIGGKSTCSRAGCGVIYKLDSSGHETVLHTFAGGPGGADPAGGVISDAAGNLYGTVVNGGGPGCYQGCGFIYELDLSGRLTILYGFTGGDDAGNPVAGLARDAAGNLYGTNQNDGTGIGTAFKLDAAGVLHVLYTFQGYPDYENTFNPGVALDLSGNVYGSTPYNGGVAAGIVYKVDASNRETTLFRFTPAPGGTSPYAVVIRDDDGNLYGTTFSGGTSNAGIVYRIDALGQQSVLHSFTGGADGGFPRAGVIRDADGNLYGATTGGGNPACPYSGCGVVYKLDPSGQETVLYSFTGGADGGAPLAAVIRDSAGNLYGTTGAGGATGCYAWWGLGCGVVYQLDPSGHATVLHTFDLEKDGGQPIGGLVRDSAGNLYGTTSYGGYAGGGVLFKLGPSGEETMLHSFTAEGSGAGGPEGAFPDATVILDAAGNLYGTAWAGGSTPEGCATFGCGVVYKLDPAGDYTVLYSFTGGADGGTPFAGLVRDAAGNLYGTASDGGIAATGCIPYYGPGCGVVFKLDTSGIETVLHEFAGADGGVPYAGVILDATGNLSGTTYYGGPANAGVVYKLTVH